VILLLVLVLLLLLRAPRPCLISMIS